MLFDLGAEYNLYKADITRTIPANGKFTERQKQIYNIVLEGNEYIINNINTNDEELNAFLFSLGCYTGEPITVVAKKRSGIVVSIKDGRYSIDSGLSDAIEI